MKTPALAAFFEAGELLTEYARLAAGEFDQESLDKMADLQTKIEAIDGWVLHHRVESAARKVCGVENFRVSLGVARKNRECVSATIDSAMGKIDDGALTALHQKHLTLAGRS